MKFGRKCQVTDQLAELAIEHQIYDMIDAAGFEGITVMEVCYLLLEYYRTAIFCFALFSLDSLPFYQDIET